MSYLLDTCVLSELMKERPARQVAAWVSACREDHLYVSVITIGELEKGIALLPASAKRERLRNWVDTQLVERFRGRILPVSAEVASAWGRLEAESQKKGRPLPAIDAILAATALVHNLVLVTRDTGILSPETCQLFNPWVE